MYIAGIRELTEKNVLGILKDCLRKEHNAGTKKVLSIHPAMPEIYLDVEALNRERANIRDMFGQTRVIHSEVRQFEFSEGKYLQDGSVWTNSDKNLAYFYFLLSGTNNINNPHYENNKVYYRIFQIASPTIFDKTLGKVVLARLL